MLAARWPVGRLAYIWRRLWRWRFKKSPYGCRGFNLLGTDIRRFLGRYPSLTYVHDFKAYTVRFIAKSYNMY